MDSVQEPVTAVTPAGGAFEVQTGGGSYTARQVVVASGARLKKLGVPGEAEYEGRGVSQCADCDGPMFQNEEVAVVGRRRLGAAGSARAREVLRQGARARTAASGCAPGSTSWTWLPRSRRSPIVPNTALDAILGGKMVEKIRIRGTQDNQTKEMPCAGVFVNIGLTPNSDFLPAEVKRDEHGGVVTGDGLETSVKGIWAVGAVRSGYSGLLKDAAAEARIAASAVSARLGKA